MANDPANAIRAGDLVVCGAERVYVLDGSRLDGQPGRRWTWSAADGPAPAPRFAEHLSTTDECKPIEGGRRLLISSSYTGGAAVVRTADGQVEFFAPAFNAHSIELLPGNRVAVAVSGAPDGNRVILYSLDRSGAELFSLPLVSGHGVVWDEQRQRLWALGGDVLLELALANWSSSAPRLEVLAEHELPGGRPAGGHDLVAVPDSPHLWLSINRDCLSFDRDRRTFGPHPMLAGQAKIKSMNLDPLTGRLAYVQASSAHWWSDTIHLMNPPRALQLPREQIYKARWVIAGQ